MDWQVSAMLGQRVRLIEDFGDGWSQVEVEQDQAGAVPSNYLQALR